MLPDRSLLIGQKLMTIAKFGKLKVCGQTVLPDRSILIGQKLLKNANIQKFKYDILCGQKMKNAL